MTRDHNAKRAIRERMRATGERYTQARSALLGSSAASPPVSPTPDLRGGEMNIPELLEQLDRDGYAVVRRVASHALVDDVGQWARRLIDDELQWRLDEAERRRAAGEADVRPFPRGMEGRFHITVADPRSAQLAADVVELATAMGTRLFGRITIDACMPGWGAHEGLHDELTGPAPRIGSWDGAVFIWPLTESWRGVRIVPGSHLEDPVFSERFAGAIAPHPMEVHIEAEPGDVVIYSLHAWKSATFNPADELRSEASLTFKRDAAVSAAHAERWATANIRDADGPYDPGNTVLPPRTS